MSTAKVGPRRLARDRLCALEVAFPCVVCSFVVVVLLLCFCCCPLLLYRLRGEIGYNYLALLYFILGLVIFGVVGEALLLARRRGRLPCCPVDEPRAAAPAFGRDRILAASKVEPCHVHAARPSPPLGPPPAYDFVSSGRKPPPSPLLNAAKTPAKDWDVKKTTRNLDVNSTTKLSSNTTTAKYPGISTINETVNKNPGTHTVTKEDYIRTTSRDTDDRTVNGNSDVEVDRGERTKVADLQSTGDPTS